MKLDEKQYERIGRFLDGEDIALTSAERAAAEELRGDLALLGEADGFELIDGQPVKNGRKDGAVTVGEFVDYLLRTTATTASEAPRRKNNARPQVTGSFDRNDAL